MSYNILGGFDNFLGGLIVGSDDSDNKSNSSNQSDNKSNVSSYLNSQQSDNKSNHSVYSPKSNHSVHSPKSNHSEEELFASDYTREEKHDKSDDLIEYINSNHEHKNNLSTDKDKKKKPKNINTSPKSPHSMGSAFSSPNTPIKHSRHNTPIKHSGPNTPIKHSPLNNSTLNSPTNNSTPNTPNTNSTPNTPSSDKHKHKNSKHKTKKHKNSKHEKHKNSKHETKKHENKKHKNESPLHSTVDSDTEPPSTSKFVEEAPSFEKLEKLIDKESNSTTHEKPEEQSDFIKPEEDGELTIVNLNNNANTEKPSDSDEIIFKGSSEDSPFAVLGGYINSTFST